MTIKKLSIWAGVTAIMLASLPVISTPAYAGKAFNGSNATGTNTSNNTGTNTSNNTGGNASNNTGGNNSNSQGKSGYNARVLAQARALSNRLRIAKATGNQAEIQAVLAEARQFLGSIKQPKGRDLKLPIVRSRQGW